MPSLDLSRLLNPAHWMDGNPGAPSSWYWLLVVFFAALSVAGGITYSYLRPNRYAGHSLHFRMAEVVGMALASLGLWGLFLMLVRFLGIGFVSARILVYLTLLGAVALAIYAVYWRVRQYPARLTAYLRDEERKRYLPTPKAARANNKPLQGATAAKKKTKGKK